MPLLSVSHFRSLWAAQKLTPPGTGIGVELKAAWLWVGSGLCWSSLQPFSWPISSSRGAQGHPSEPTLVPGHPQAPWGDTKGEVRVVGVPAPRGPPCLGDLTASVVFLCLGVLLLPPVLVGFLHHLATVGSDLPPALGLVTWFTLAACLLSHPLPGG